MLLGHFWTGLKRAECCYLAAQRSMDFCNPRHAQQYQTTIYMHYPLKKNNKKVPFRVKNPLEMHSTDALYLKTPCPFPLGINQFHRGKTQLSSWTQLLLDRIHFSCVGCFHLWDIQKNTGSLSGPINLNWMSFSICVIVSRHHLLLNLMWRTWMTGLTTALRHAACNSKTHLMVLLLDVTKLSCTINT